MLSTAWRHVMRGGGSGVIFILTVSVSRLGMCLAPGMMLEWPVIDENSLLSLIFSVNDPDYNYQFSFILSAL